MRTLSVAGLALCAALLQAQTAPDTQPGVVVRNDPEYSAEATRAFVQSTVLLSIVVGEDGKAHDIKVAQPSGFGLDEKAVEAIQTWVFRPGTKDGHPVPMPANVEMNFHLQVRNDTEDHSYQFGRLNFTLPPEAIRPVLITGKLPGNPHTAGDQALRFHLQVGIDGVPSNITVLSSTDKAWEQQALRVIRGWRFRPASLAGLAIPADGIFELAHSAPPEPEPQPIIVEQDDSDRVPRPAAAPIEIPGLTPRSGHTATLLGNGTVLVAGGSASPSAQTFDPVTRTIATTGSLLTARQHHTATLLKDGTVLITGGQPGGQPGGRALASAEIFDPSTGKFSPTGSMHEARSSHAAALLPDGRVLICGGSADDTSEIYDPRQKIFLSAGHMLAPMPSLEAVTLKDGSIFLLGSASTPAEIFHPETGTFTAAGAQHFAGIATLLHNGTVLIFGADGVETFNPGANAFQTDTAMPGTPAASVLLPSGKVLVTGTPTEIYDPSSQSFTRGPVLKQPQSGDTATLLDNDNVLVAGPAAELLILN